MENGSLLVGAGKKSLNTYPNNDSTSCSSPAKRSRMLTSAIIVLDSSDEEEEEAARPDKHMARVTGGPSGGSEDSPDAQDDDVVCIVCTSASNGAEMLLCDSCDTAGAHHIGCLDPPLTSLPEGLWFCPDCILDQKDREGRCSVLSPSQAEEKFAQTDVTYLQRLHCMGSCQETDLRSK